MKKLLLLFVLATTVNINAQESVLLRLKYSKGDVYKMEIKITQDMGAIMSSTINITMSQEINSVTKDEYTSQMKIEKMTMDMLQGGNVLSYDSSKSDEELDETGKAMKAQMAPMLSANITARGNNLGEVLETKLEPNVPGLEDMTKQSGGIVYPKEAVSVGDDWSATKNEKGMNFNFTYKVVSISSKEVKLNVTGKVSGMAEGTISGAMVIDVNTGVPTNSKIDVKMSVSGQEMLTGVETKMIKQN